MDNSPYRVGRRSFLNGTIDDLKAPLLGEHNHPVLHDLLGMQTDEIAALYDDGVLVSDKRVRWTTTQTVRNRHEDVDAGKRRQQGTDE